MSYRNENEDDLPLLPDELNEKRRDIQARPTPMPPVWTKRQSSTSYSRVALVATISCLITTIICLCIGGVLHRRSLAEPLKWESYQSRSRPGTVTCGNSIAEAHANDCIFDELSMAWQPQKCSRKWSDEYARSNDGGKFEYWHDRHGRELLKDPSAKVGDGFFFWTTNRNHLVHCQYNLYRLADSLRNGDYLAQDDGQTLADHLHHCVMTMTQFALLAPEDRLNRTDIVTEPGFAYC